MKSQIASMFAHVLLLGTGAYGAKDSDPRPYCLQALTNVYKKIPFADIKGKQRHGAECSSELAMASILASEYLYCSGSEFSSLVNGFEDYCEKRSPHSVAKIKSLAANVDTEWVKKLHTYSQDDFQTSNTEKKHKIKEPCLISEQWFHDSYKTIADSRHENWRHRVNGWGIYGFWATIVALGTIRNITLFFRVSRQKRSLRDSESIHASPRATLGFLTPITKLNQSFQSYVAVPRMLPWTFEHPLLSWSVPTRLEGLVLGASWILQFALCCTDYRGFPGNIKYPAPSVQVLQYICDRTGSIAAINFPLIWLFSGRNNIFIWTTGWSFSTFNVFHRHLARVASVQATIHAVCYTVFYLRYKGGPAHYKEEWLKPFWYMGVAALFGMCILVASGHNWFKRRRYETFLIIHILLSVVIVVGSFYHVRKKGKRYTPYMWPVVALWSFDRAVRLLRVALCSLRVRRNSGNGIEETKSNIHYDEEADMLTISLDVSASILRPSAGQQFFLYQPLRWKGWENHPFSLAYWSVTESPATTVQQTGSRCPVAEINREKCLPSATSSPLTSSAASSILQGGKPFVTCRQTYEFWARPRDGWTKELRQQCMSNPQRSCSPRLLLEGPYGEKKPTSLYERMVFVAGGSGIAAIVPYLLEYQTRRNATAHVIWVNRKGCYAKSIIEKQLRDVFSKSGGNVTARLFITDSASVKSPDEGDCSGDAGLGAFEGESRIVEQEKQASGTIKSAICYTQGRPDISELLQQFANEARECRSRFAVMACGPAAMTETVRARMARLMRQNQFAGDYFEEAFGW